MLRAIITLWALACFYSATLANTGLSFLNFGQLPRAAALGEAFTAGAGDITSANVNPAGLASLENIQIAFMHKAWFLDIFSNYGAVALPLGSGVYNLGLLVTTTPDIELRDAATLQPLGSTDAQDIAFGLGWSGRYRQFDLGISAKLLYEKIHLSSASGWGIDFGTQYQFRDLRFGASVLNLGPDLKFRQEKFSLPAQFRLGVGYTPPQEFLQGEWLLLADLVSPKESESYYGLGAEYNYQDYLSLRLGYKNSDQNQSKVSFGLGVEYGRYAVDYAFLPFKSDLGSSHQIALILKL
jgi:hypothetical protein